MPALRRPRLTLALLGHTAALSIANTAFACPDCVTGRAARASVFGPDFAFNLAAITSPLLLLTAIVALLHRSDKKGKTP